MQPQQSQTLKLVIVAAISLMVGYFAGREHLKYEMRAAMASAAEEMSKSFASIFGGGNGESASSEPTTSKPAADKRPAQSTPPAPQPISVSLTAKDLRESNYSAGIYDDAITFALELGNRTGKDVRAFEGTLTFYDLLDNRILGSKLTITNGIKVGAKTTWKGELDYNQFMDSHQRLANEALENLKIEFRASKVLFGDGSSQQFD